MTTALGAESYVAAGMQTAFGSAATPTITMGHIRSGQPFTPRQGKQSRITTSRVIPGADQLWDTYTLTDFSYEFEALGTAAAFLPWMRAAWGHELKAGAGPVTHQYNIQNPPVDTGTDGANDFYNHALTLRHTFASNAVGITNATFETRDACVNEHWFSCEANNTVRVGFSGTGQNFQAATAVAYSEPAGTTFAWKHLYATANGGIYSGSANPPTTALPLKSFKFTLNNNLRFAPFLGTGTGLELKKPTRNGYPTMQCEVAMDFDDDSADDAIAIMADFLTSTTRNLRIKSYIDANNAIEFLASGASNRPCVIDQPKVSVPSEGVVEAVFTFQIYPVTPTGATPDVKIVWTTAT